jgi:hypothetical protein
MAKTAKPSLANVSAVLHIDLLSPHHSWSKIIACFESFPKGER